MCCMNIVLQLYRICIIVGILHNVVVMYKMLSMTSHVLIGTFVLSCDLVNVTLFICCADH